MKARDAGLPVLGGFLAFTCLISSGCAVPYAYPHVSYIPGLATGPRHDQVHAFCIDVTGDILDAGEEDDYLLAPVDLSPGGRTSAQARLTLDYGYYVIGIAVNFPVHHGHSTLLRLYQPGYRLVEVCAWDMPDKVEWQATQDLDAQEKAVDDLLRTPSIEAARTRLSHAKGWNSHSLRPGSAAQGHREALLFAASEFERLIALVDPNEAGSQARKDRLLRKAYELRERAVD